MNRIGNIREKFDLKLCRCRASNRVRDEVVDGAKLLQRMHSLDRWEAENGSESGGNFTQPRESCDRAPLVRSELIVAQVVVAQVVVARVAVAGVDDVVPRRAAAEIRSVGG
ncbi:hypothetical protein [Methylobacterium sp. JK268]